MKSGSLESPTLWSGHRSSQSLSVPPKARPRPGRAPLRQQHTGGEWRHRGSVFPQQQGVPRPPSVAAPAVDVLASQDFDSLSVQFSNDSDPEHTVITLSGPHNPALLAQVTAAFTSLDLVVQSASIQSLEDGSVLDTFRVTSSDNRKVDDSSWESVREAILAQCGGPSSRSSKPSIYGARVAADVAPLRETPSEQQAASLEAAAADMAAAAAALVAVERDIVGLTQRNGDSAAVAAKTGERAEAAAGLERRLAALEALLSARRAPLQEAPPPTAARGPGVLHQIQQRGQAVASGPACGDGYEVILQGFNWESHRAKPCWYKLLGSKAGDIAAAGFTTIWLPPPSDSVSPQGYLPRDLYNLDSAYGSQGELRACVAQLHEHNVKVMADIVINHRCAHGQDGQGRWNRYGGRLAWGTEAICCNNPEFGGTGNHKTGEDYHAAPNLDHTQPHVRQDIIQWLKFLRSSLNVDAFRFDFVKGYSGRFVKEYVDETAPALVIGEFWDTCDYSDGVLNYNQDAHRQRTVDWCDSTSGVSGAFDFTTKGILQEACARGEYWRLCDSQGRPPGTLGMWPSRSVSFIDSHDTGSTLNHWPFPASHLAEGHAYILTHPGTPCIFWDHYVDDSLGPIIRQLIQVRRKSGLHCRSKVAVQASSANLYAALLDGRLAMKVGSGDWSPNSAGVQVGQSSWELAVSGKNFAVWLAVK